MSDKVINLVTLPKWGLAMQEGTIIGWHKGEGDVVVEGEALCDIETSKITNEFESPFTGTLARIAKPSGSVVDVGDVIAVVTDGAVDNGDISDFLANLAGTGTKTAAIDSGPVMKQIETEAGAIAYMETGPTDSDRAVLFLHGFGGDHANWGFLQAQVLTTQRSIAIDMPGHGASDRAVGDGSPRALADRVEAFIVALGLKRLDVVAHSLGAVVALHLCEKTQAHIDTLLLIAPVGMGVRPNPLYVQGFLGAERKRDMRHVMEMLFANPAMLGRTMVTDALALLRDVGAREALEKIGSHLVDDALDIGEDLKFVGERPTQIVWGGADQIVPMPAELGRRLDSRLVVVGAAGHMPHVEQPVLVAKVLRDLASFE